MPKRREAPGARGEAPSLAGLASIRCMRCEQDKPAAGARPFHAHMVCADCTRQVIAAAAKGQAQRAAS